MIRDDLFTLDNFSGSLDFLIHLIDKQEVSIAEVPIRILARQFSGMMPIAVDTAAEWLYDLSYLAWLKSKALLPVHEQVIQKEDEPDPQFEVIHHLVDYCRFRDAAKSLSERREDQSGYFVRAVPECEEKKRKPLDPFSLEQLTALLKEILKKAPQSPSPIKEDPWRISDKISEIKTVLKKQRAISFLELFDYHRPRLELIVLFLALLELMKRGEASVKVDPITKIWTIYE